MGNLLNKNKHSVGIMIGLFLPIIGFFIVYGAAFLLQNLFHYELTRNLSAFKLIGIAFNLFPIRYYFINKKHELTGRGLLLVTFIYVVVYFWLQ